jgi:fido (protein-threonine AMPylation protein)
MHPADCPAWEYNNHPRRGEVLARRQKEVLVDLGRHHFNTVEIAVNTRPVHRRLFFELTPPNHEYYAGHYRGESYRCLYEYQVMVHGDPRVGSDPAVVAAELKQIERVIRDGLAVLDANRNVPDAHVSKAQKLLHVVVLACRVFEVFLRIHPYANGNGHAARFLIWSLLSRYGYWPKGWPIEPRPPDPPYTQLITEYRNGNWEPLEEFVLNTVV